MEEDILEIIWKYNVDLFMQVMRRSEDTDKDALRPIAEEITAHVMEFVEWLCFDDKSHYRCGVGWRIGQGIKEHNINEVYQYWLDNVKNK